MTSDNAPAEDTPNKINFEKEAGEQPTPASRRRRITLHVALTPYIGDRRTFTWLCKAIASGSVQFLAHILKWRRRGDTGLRTGGLFLAGAGAAAFVRAEPALAPTALGAAWITAALACAPRSLWKATAEAADETQRETPEQAPEPVTPERFLTLVHAFCHDGRNVHLATLAEHITARLGGEWDVAAVRALCEASQVPVRRIVRAPGRKPTVGIHHADLPPLPDPAPAPPESELQDV